MHSVSVEPVEINTSKDEIVQISWELSESGMLDVFICDIGHPSFVSLHFFVISSKARNL